MQWHWMCLERDWKYWSGQCKRQARFRMIDKKVDMSVPKVNILEFAEVPMILGGEKIW